MSRKKEVVIFTDGACHRNPGPGGYGVVMRYGEHCKELSGGVRLTTNNRMELQAVIAGLEALKSPCRVLLHSDSRYVVDSASKGWARRWRANGWRQKGSKLAANPDQWEKLLDLCAIHEVTFIWVKGHAGIPDNERCDVLAEAACLQADLPADVFYEVQVAQEVNSASERTIPEGLFPTDSEAATDKKFSRRGRS